MKTLIILCLLATASCNAGPTVEPVRTAKSQDRLDVLLRGKTVGATRSCLPYQDARQQTIIDERTIIFSANGGRRRLYRSNIDNCPGLDRNSTIIRRSTQTSICSGEIFEVRDSGTQFPRGACTFGDFTEYSSAAR